MKKTTKTLQALFILGFLTLLTLPSIGWYLQFDQEKSDIEKRKLTAFPEFTANREFFEQIGAYLDDHFGWRSTLLDFNGKIKLYVFATSPQPEKVQPGRNRWLYYVSREGGIFSSFTKRNKLEADELERYKTVLAERTIQCKAKGIRYLTAIWPNKHTVYPEFMNRRMRLQIEPTSSRLDQLQQLHRENSGEFELYTVTERLLKEKNTRQVYHKNDSHWNDDGAFFAFTEFMSLSFPDDYLKFNLTNFSRKEEDFCKGDLLSMMGLESSQFYCEKNPVIDYSQGCLDSSQRIPLKILVFGDSYFDKLLPLFNCSFKEVVLIKGYFNDESIEDHKPDVILSANVERNIAL